MMSSVILLVVVGLVVEIGCGHSGPDGKTVVGIDDVKTLPDADETDSQRSADWLTWRGPNRNGLATHQSPPTEWSDETNVLWKTKVPGRGHASPIIVGDRIFLTTADRQAETQSILCFDRNTGEALWSDIVHEGGLTTRIHPNNSSASPSVTSDGENVFCLFINDGQTQLTKYSLDGERVWHKILGQFRCDYGFGYGASPIIWNSKLIVSSECSSDSFMVALDPDSGSEIWRVDRPANTSFSTPVVANVAGKYQLLLSGGKNVKGYDPETGKELWSVPADWSVTCGTMVWDGDLAFASGGFPKPQTLAIKADGSAEILWDQKVKCYEQSMLAHKGFLYGLTDAGICYCWKAETGEVQWKKRMKPKSSASPVLAGGHIYFTTEDGTCFVIKADPENYEVVATNRLGTSAFATPTFVDDKIYTRVGTSDASGRQEWLYCLGESE